MAQAKKATTKAKPKFVRVGSGWDNKKGFVLKVNGYTFFVNPNDYKRGAKSPSYFVSTLAEDQKSLGLLDSTEYYHITKDEA